MEGAQPQDCDMMELKSTVLYLQEWQVRARNGIWIGWVWTESGDYEPSVAAATTESGEIATQTNPKSQHLCDRFARKWVQHMMTIIKR